ncbi:MAG: YkgJ family cysteine cluster protein [Verrucomicrobiota bacterium]
MKSFRIETPSIQNWSCHGCTACCRGFLLIELSDQEKQRIQGQRWAKADGVDPATMIAEEKGRFRLGHQSDGACIFLDAAGRCRIHSRFGEAAKPRACRLFPLTLHPMGKKLVAGVRFSCPSAAANSGKPLSEQLSVLNELAGLVVPEGFAGIPAPAVLKKAGLDWRDFMRFVSWLDKTMSAENQPVGLKLRRALHWLGAVEKAGFDQIAGQEADEILGALSQNAAAELPSDAAAPPPPTRMGRLLFRTLVLTYARRDLIQDLKAGVGRRARMLGAMLQFVRGSGRVPGVIPGLEPVEFAAIEKSFGALPPGAEAGLTRFFRVKIQSLHFCGRAYYGMALIEGFENLALLYPVILWLARWQAAAEKRGSLTGADIERATSLADHHHGYSPILARAWSRQRVRLLAQRDDIARLCGAY